MSETIRPAEARAIERIAAATRTLVLRSKARNGDARRDVHPKHHGCVLARFVVYPDVPRQLRHGVLSKSGSDFRAWVRFSSSSKTPQSDEIPDGRGIAIKLLDVPGERLPQAQPGEQDFVLLNYPAFFARDAEEMAEVSELEVRDAFPGSFFLRLDRVRGLRAFLGMAARDVRSPLQLQYFSQTPYRLGPDEVVKLRLTPLFETDFVPTAAQRKSGNHLFHALRTALAPQAGEVVTSVPAGFELSVQLPVSELDAIEDATVVWRGEYVPVARIELLPQHLGGAAQWALAEQISFSPWNGLVAHEPLGSINRVRRIAYEASRRTRQAARRELTVAEWEAERAARLAPLELWSPPSPPPDRARVVIALRMLLPEATQWLATRAASIAYALSIALFAVVVCCGHVRPGSVLAPFSLGLGPMPSEDWIPKPKISARGEKVLDARGRPRGDSPAWSFRYEPTGSELHGGLPYWVYRALPRLFPQQFLYRDDWSRFGLYPDDDDDYYDSYHDLPRGLVMSDTRLSLGGNQVDVRLKRVSFNCASCHRGEIAIGKERRFISGMPNAGIDTASYKRVVFALLASPSFTASRLIEAVNALLREEAAKQGKAPHALTTYERFVYRTIASISKRQAQARALAWMDSRPPNGVGRLDAFGALRFEFLTGYDPASDHTIATVDLPSIWNQRSSVRSRHHWDGNTSDARARNFGAIVGVGASEPSIRRELVESVGKWIDGLPSPRYREHFEIEEDFDARVAEGERVYKQEKCHHCHGTYEDGRLVGALPRCMTEPSEDVETDGMRAAAVDTRFADRLNAFGSDHGLWDARAFRSSGGKYLCPPLDGIWARSPYLHNGSVPTLDALLRPVDQRPKTFWRGDPQLDPALGGFRYERVESAAAPTQSFFDTTEEGNHNTGHAFFPKSDDDRKKLIAYLLDL